MSDDLNLTEIVREFGGTVISPDVAPHVAVILGSNSGSLCSGSLLTLHIVLTMARCFTQDLLMSENPRSIRVLAGVHSLSNLTDQHTLQEATVSEVVMHPNFKLSAEESSFGYNDLALLKLSDSFEETYAVKPAPLGHVKWWKVGKVKCILAGFGAVNPLNKAPEDDELKMHEVEATRKCRCKESMEKLFGPRVDRWLCLESVVGSTGGPCVGSAGAGLICDGHLIAMSVGVIPFQDISRCEYQYPSSVTCDGSRTVAVFLELCPFQPWFYLIDADIPHGPINCSVGHLPTPTPVSFLLFFMCSFLVMSLNTKILITFCYSF